MAGELKDKLEQALIKLVPADPPTFLEGRLAAAVGRQRRVLRPWSVAALGAAAAVLVAAGAHLAVHYGRASRTAPPMAKHPDPPRVIVREPDAAPSLPRMLIEEGELSLTVIDLSSDAPVVSVWDTGTGRMVAAFPLCSAQPSSDATTSRGS
jgi:hypothetical protein